MNSQVASNWIQLLTGIAVLVGLGLVVWELQQNREATMSQLSSEYYQIAAQERSAIFGEQAAQILAKACHSPNKLTPADLVVLDNIYAGQIARVDRMRVLSQRGDFYDDGYWKQRIGNLDWLFTSYAGRAYWKGVAPNYVDSEVLAYGNDYLAKWTAPMCHEEHASWMIEINKVVGMVDDA